MTASPPPGVAEAVPPPIEDSPKTSPKASPKRQRGNRTGWTTGACAAAAARAATLAWLAPASAQNPTEIGCLLPNGQWHTFAVHHCERDAAGVTAVVIKDAGDDPDCTDGAHLTARVRPLPDAAGQVRLCGGAGVGRVTRAGLGLPLGEAAINPVPRRNIDANVRAVAGDWLRQHGLEVCISVPGGEVMARRTLNARLGIVGGISILGTTGIVRPYSTAAFRASVVQAIQVAARQGLDEVVLTTGGRTEKCAMRQRPDLAEAAFVQMGDFVKAAFSAAIAQGMRHITVGAMAGKLTKMAMGLPVTHAWRKAIDRELLADVAREIGAPNALVAAIGSAETARFAAETLGEIGLALRFYRALGQRTRHALRSAYPGDYQLRLLICDFDGQLITQLDEDVPA